MSIFSRGYREEGGINRQSREELKKTTTGFQSIFMLTESEESMGIPKDPLYHTCTAF